MKNDELSVENASNILLYEHDTEKLNYAIEHLNQHMRNKEHFRPYVFSIHVGETIIDKDFSTKNIRMSYYKDCIIKNCNFFEAGCAGSVFWGTKFIDCKLDSSKFPSCDFRNCDFIFTENTEVNSIDLNGSFFFEYNYKNIVFNSANFEDIVFKSGSFINVKWHSVSVENALINRSNLTNMRFSSQNFDFLTLENIKANNVVFPFPAMPFVINGLTYIYNTNDDIRFTSCGDGIKRISREEYLEQMVYFEDYYLNTDNFFPLANIYVAQGRIENAMMCIQAGLVQSIKSRNFRLLLNFCKILKNNLGFDIQHRKKLYNQILIEINKESLKNIDYEILSSYIPKIKEMLLGTDNEPYIIVDIKTNIDSSDYYEISNFISDMKN